MPISMQCDCGKPFRVKDEAAGRKVRCPGCKTVLSVPDPEPEKSAEDDALNVFLTADPPPLKPTPKRSSSKRDQEDRDDDDEDEGITAKPPLPKPVPSERRRSEPRRRHAPWKSAGRERPSRSGPWFVLSPTMITGLLMMLGAVVWFGAGLALGIIFFYPPVLFVLGIAAVIRGLFGHED